MPVEATPRPAEKANPPVGVTAGSVTVALLVTDVVETPRVIAVVSVNVPGST